MINQDDKIKLKDGRYAFVVEVLEPLSTYLADVQLSGGNSIKETVLFSDIAARIVEVEHIELEQQIAV